MAEAHSRGMRHSPDPTADLAKARDWRALRMALPYLWPRNDPGLRARLVLSVFLLNAAAFVNALVPVLFGQAVDQLSQTSGALVAPVALVFAYGFVHWLGKALNELRWTLYGPIEQRVKRYLGLAAFRHLHELSLRFHLGRRTGSLSRVLDSGLRGTDELLFNVVFIILPLFAEIAFMCAMLLAWFQPVFALLAVGTLGLYTVALVIGSEWLRRHQRRAVIEQNEAHGKAIDGLLNYETVKFFGNERHIADRYDEALHRVEKLTVQALIGRSMTGLLQVSILGVGLTAMLLLAGGETAAGGMTVGDFVMVNTYMMQLLRPLDRMGQLYRQIKQALIDVEHLMALFEQPAEVTDKPGAIALPKGPGEARFENVTFAYDPRRGPVLNNVSFTVAPGKVLGLVGSSGAGKSTIGRLLFRFYDPTGGRVLIDGRDLRDLTQASLRAAIAVVPQDPVLFNESIYYNIAFGRPDAGRDDVIAAARLAQIHDFVASLPDGYDTMVGERGLKLSGGEKQRVAIARAVLKQPCIFLFDEATSALDSHTEKAIQRSLREVSRGMTTLVIAHRLSTVVDADEIIVLEDGAVVERGRHDQLLRLSGRYASLWARQQEALEAAD